MKLEKYGTISWPELIHLVTVILRARKLPYPRLRAFFYQPQSLSIHRFVELHKPPCGTP